MRRIVSRLRQPRRGLATSRRNYLGGRPVGISAMSVYTPKPRVDLEEWCQWTGNDWGKISAVVGSSFRVPPPDEDVYTLAANAVLRLIKQNDVNPCEVGMLGFGTESSKDSSAGSVIIKGLVNSAADEMGGHRISRHCEVPESKHACIGGHYALKNALRYAATDGAGKKAIVVAADIAEYQRGSSGEPTQGAGAVAMLVETDPKMLELDLARTGSSSAYRVVDFRKPQARHTVKGYTPDTMRAHDFPVFNGAYSTFCYIESVLRASEAYFAGTQTPLQELLETDSIFAHRPYAHMPRAGVTRLALNLLAHAPDQHLAGGVFSEVCEAAGQDPAKMREVLSTRKNLYQVCTESQFSQDPFPEIKAVEKALTKTPFFKELLAKMTLGGDVSAQMGNTYAAALFGWLAAGLEEAAESNRELNNLMLVAYGSGDAADMIRATTAPNWRDPALRIGARAALDGHYPLNQEAYEQLHDTGLAPWATDAGPTPGTFTLARRGANVQAGKGQIEDAGIDYYQYSAAAE